MKANRDALRRFVLGELPPPLQEREEEFFAEFVRDNCTRLGILGLLGAVLQAAVLISLREMPIMHDLLMRWFTLLAVIGLFVFGLFFFRQTKGNMPVPALWACQVAFAVYYTVVDLCILFLGHQMQAGLVRMVPAVMLGTMMTMTGGLSLTVFGGYALCTLLLVGEPALFVYGLLSVVAAYMLSRERYKQLISRFAVDVKAEKTEQLNQELHHRLERLTTWDDQTQMNNRRAMSSWLEAVWPLCVRNRIHVAVMVVSPYGIEKVRKEKGPDVAAARLNQFAAALKPFVRRQSDFLGRYEEDKFIILYSGPSRQDTDMLHKRIQDELQKQVWSDAQAEALFLNMGIVYGLPGDNMVAAQWMTRADDVLEKAKSQGAGTVLIEEA
jgi:diguanylate cyclase (GGDEF)-like protein